MVTVETDAAGEVGERVTWTVGDLDDLEYDGFAFKLERDGEVCETASQSSATFSYSPDEPGEYQLFVEVRQNSAVVATGQSAKLFVAAPPLPDPEVTFLDPSTGSAILPEAIVPGQEIRISAAVTGAYISAPSLYRLDGEQREAVETRQNGGGSNGFTLTVPMRELIPGEYLLEMRVQPQSPYYSVPEGGLCEYRFTVSDEGVAPPVVTADKTEAYLTNDAVTLTIQAEGADSAFIEFRLSNGNGGTGRSWTRSFAEGDRVAFRFAAKRNGTWSDWTQREYTVQGLPPLDALTISCQSSYSGEDIAIRFDAVANAQGYYYTLYRSQEYLEGESVTPGSAIVLPGYRLDPGSYRIEIRAEAEGYISSAAYREFTVTRPGAAPDATVDKTHLASGERAMFTVTSDDAEALVVRDSRENGGTYYTRVNVFEDETQWATTQNWGSGTRTYAFAALVNGSWSAWSDGIAITADNGGQEQLPAPVIAAPSQLALGRDLAVSVVAEGATYCDIELYNSQGSRIYDGTLYLDNGNTQTIPGYRLPQGGLTLRVTARDAGRSASAETAVSVANSGSRPAAPVIEPASQDAAEGTRISFDIPTEGADRVAVRYFRSGYSNNVSYNDFEAMGDTTSWSRSGSSVGDVWKFAFAVRADGVWSPWSAIRTVRIVEAEQ